MNPRVDSRAYYAKQWQLLADALRAAFGKGAAVPVASKHRHLRGPVYVSDFASQFFRHYHGYQCREQAWSLFADDTLLRFVVGLWAQREPSRAWRYLWRVTIDEAARRDMLPTADDLSIAADLAEAQGVLTTEAIERWTFVELWARCMPLLWSLRGDRTL